jgi:hypothetical protein
MKKIFPVSLLALTILLSCGNEKPIQSEEDSLAGNGIDSAAESVIVESLLDLKSESDIIRKYGANAVTYDTIWGAEGFFTMGTWIKTDDASHIEIMWTDSAKREGVISASLVSDADYFAPQLPAGKWKSRTGVFIGMSIEELEKLNGRPFIFSGFGWDYGGGIIRWENGTLQDKGIAIQLNEGVQSSALPEKEYLKCVGDVELMSSDTSARKMKPRVWSFSVAKIQD